MPVYQTNLWVCEICGGYASTTHETHPGSDPVVTPPDGGEWEYVVEDDEEVLGCPKCADGRPQKGWR